MNKYKVDILSNKLPVISVPVKGASTVTALIVVKTGSKYEGRDNNGISHFLEHMFFKGTKRRPDTLAISSELDSLGGEYNAFTSKEFTGYWVKVSAAKIRKALDIMSDMLLNSRFEQSDIDQEKGVIIEELNMYEDNPLMHIEDVFEDCLYGDTPAGWETIGTKSNIQRFVRSDFIQYLNSQYGANSMYVVLAGGIKHQDKQACCRLLEKFPSNVWHNKIKVKNQQTKPEHKVVAKNTDQINLSLGVRTYPVGHPDEFKLRLLSIILGGSMSSRLFINLRVKNGLAYYVKTSTEFYSDCGYLTTQAGVPNDKAAAAIKIILAEYRRISECLIDANEIKRAKDLLRGKLLLQSEATDNLANWYARQAILREKILSPQEFIRAINKISSRDLRKVARQVFIDKNLNLAVIGQIGDQNLSRILKF